MGIREYSRLKNRYYTGAFANHATAPLFCYPFLMRVLVTGSAGFIGSHLVDALIRDGHEVFGIDNLSIGTLENISPEAKSNFTVLDMRDYDRLRRYVSEVKPGLIYHLAAWAHEGLSQFAPRLITENNYLAFINLIVPAIQNGLKRIVVGSSMSVYGDQDPPFDEEMPRKPVDIYAVSKVAMEEATEILARVHGFDYTIVRPHNVYGPRQSLRDPYRNVVGIFINRLLQNKPPIIYGDGEQTRAFSYIDDVVPYLSKCGFQNNVKGEIINLGPRKEYTVNQLAEAVVKAFGSDLRPVHVEDRPVEVKHAYCTNRKAKELLGYYTAVELEEGVGKMVAWARKQGPQEFQYLKELELTGKVPETWSKHLI